MQAPLPADEPKRLRSLYRLNILDTLPEQVFDDITRLASAICGTPIALVTLVDQDRQWFKSRHGLAAPQTGRDVAFCAHAILQTDLFEIPDAREDDRFRDNPLVLGDPHIQFYAGAPLHDEAGQALGTLCVIDVEPRQLSDAQRQALLALARQTMAQFQLMAANQRWELTTGSSQDGHWDWLDMDGPQWWWSHSCFELLGLSPEEHSPNSELVQSLVHPEDLERLKGRFRAEVQVGRPVDAEVRLRVADDYRWFLVRALYTEPSQGRLKRLTGSISDIHDHKQSTEAIVRSRTRLQAILDHSAEAIFIVDNQGRIETMNPVADQLFGYTEGEMVGRSLRNLTVEPLPVEPRDFLFVRGRRSDGSELPLDVGIGQFVLGGETRYTVSVRDATPRLLQEETLRSATREAEAASLAKSQFLARMSHELRTPLNAVIGFSEVLQDQAGDRLNPKEQRFLNNILRSGQHLLSIVNDVLEICRMDSGGLGLESEPVHVGECLQRALARANTMAGPRSTTVELPVNADCWVLADPRALQLVFFQLLANAVKFTPPPGRVWVTVESHRNEVLIAVRDTGVGIPPEQQQRVFLEFEQLDQGYARNQDGTGLGLTLVKRLMEAQGKFWLESSGVPGEGSAFFVQLPKSEAGRRHSQGEASLLPGRVRILVVEPDRAVRELLDHYLSGAGYDTLVAQSSAEALRLADAVTPDIICFGLELDEQQGWTLLERLRERESLLNTPTLLVTSAEAEPADERRKSSLGVKLQLAKPVSRDRLLESVRQLL